VDQLHVISRRDLEDCLVEKCGGSACTPAATPTTRSSTKQIYRQRRAGLFVCESVNTSASRRTSCATTWPRNLIGCRDTDNLLRRLDQGNGVTGILSHDGGEIRGSSKTRSRTTPSRDNGSRGRRISRRLASPLRDAPQGAGLLANLGPRRVRGILAGRLCAMRSASPAT